MNILRDDEFELQISPNGTLESLVMSADPVRMNWVIDENYVKEAGYADKDKRFGEWFAIVDGELIESANLKPSIEMLDNSSATVTYRHQRFTVHCTYSLNRNGEWEWIIECSNPQDQPIKITGFHSWFSLSYIMFRDQDVLRNMKHSCALFPHVGGDFAKFAAMRRSNEAPHLGVYSKGESIAALGTYCSYVNRFLEQVSPSLDGILYHRISFIEDGSSLEQLAAHDWIYRDGYTEVTLLPAEVKRWSFVFTAFENQADFYKKGIQYGHPNWTYSPVITTEGQFVAEVELPTGTELQSVRLLTLSSEGNAIEDNDILTSFQVVSSEKPNVWRTVLPMQTAGEYKLVASLDNGRTDLLVGNVLEPIKNILDARAAWLCDNFTVDNDSPRPFAFLPLSNQGESLGKLTFILMKNLLSSPNKEQVAKVEMSAVADVREHWFVDCNFMQPKPLYGSFYRIYDFDYIGHLFYLLSRLDDSLLKLYKSETYLTWAAEVMCMRLNPDCHMEQREKEESQLVGVFILYIQDLMSDLQARGMVEWYEQLHKLWLQFTEGLAQGSQGYQGAITEHFYDNAGFGPTCQALCLAGLKEEAQPYSELIVANIGFSNDYRANAPDRWWEALSFMTHSLWGGLVAGAARASYEALGDPRLLEAGYRATMAIFNCYDWHVRSTARRLLPGEAASTYSIAAPNLNMPELSRNRFGQSIFKKLDDPLFNSLFASIDRDDWDMGEELVAYLLGFGTTAYLYTDDIGKLRCVNGFLESQGNGWKVTSYAAYPTSFVMVEKGLAIRADKGKQMKSVRYEDGQFMPLDVSVK